MVAKFSSTTDTRPVVKAEAVAMLLAARAGLNVAPVEVRRVSGRDVLLVERSPDPALNRFGLFVLPPSPSFPRTLPGHDDVERVWPPSDPALHSCPPPWL